MLGLNVKNNNIRTSLHSPVMAGKRTLSSLLGCTATVQASARKRARADEQGRSVKQAPAKTKKKPKAAATAVTWQPCATRTKDRGHSKDHPKFRPDCAQCVYNRRRPYWDNGPVCSHSQAREGLPGRLTWLAERPREWGGPWAVGCTLCSAFMVRFHGSSGTTKRRLSSKWSRYEVCSVKAMQACCLKQHGQTALHKLAYMAWLIPEEAQWRASD